MGEKPIERNPQYFGMGQLTRTPILELPELIQMINEPFPSKCIPIDSIQDFR